MTNSKIKTITITESDLKDFFIPENRRQIRQGLVVEIKHALREGGQYGGVIAVNKRGAKYRIIDGQHRFTAVKQVIEESEGAEEVKGHFIIYDNLSDVEEAEEYDILQRRANENLNDYIQMHKNEIPILKKIENSFPILVTHYAGKDSITYGNLLRTWLNRNNEEPCAQRKDEFVKMAKELKDHDYFQAVSFYTKFKSIFGVPSKQNVYYRFVPLWCLTSIYCVNSGVFSEGKLLELFRTRVIGDIQVIERSKYYSRECANDLRRYLLEKLNRGNRNNQLL